MRMKHLLLEVFCGFEDDNKTIPLHCLSGINHPGSNCFENQCQYLSYTNCPNEIAYAGEKGIVEDFDDCRGFGGEMNPETKDINERKVLLDKWKSILWSNHNPKKITKKIKH